MSARDELVGIVMEEANDNGLYMGTLTAEDIADAVIAWGFRKPRSITTAEELEGMHAKAVILDAKGTPWVCDGDMAEPWASVCEDPFGGPIWKDGRDILLPATVLYEP